MSGERLRRLGRRDAGVDVELDASVHDANFTSRCGHREHLDSLRAAIVGVDQPPVAQAVGLTLQVHVCIDEDQPANSDWVRKDRSEGAATRLPSTNPSGRGTYGPQKV